ncbi:MAG: response regulator [Alphaproteobacteria bacterium]
MNEHEAEKPLDGCTILLVEDEAMLALDIEHTLRAVGAAVVGPVMRLRDGLALNMDGLHVAAAILDVDLRGEDVFPLADRLRELGIPFLFHTGHAERDELRARYGDVPVCMKPVAPGTLIKKVQRIAC